MNNNDPEQTLNDSGEISIKELILKLISWWHYLLSKWKVILIAGIIGGILGYVYGYFKKPIYKAELSFALQDEKSGNGLNGALGLASQFGIDLGGGAGGEFSGDNLLELMRSRSMIEKALLATVSVNGKKETLAELYISFNNLREGWKGKPELELINYLPDANRSKFTLKQDSILGAFHNAIITDNLSVDKIDKKLSIIELQVNSANELFSKYFAEILAKQVSDFYIETKTKKGIQNVAILQRQTDSVRRALNAAISGVAVSTDVNPNLNASRQTLRVPSQRRQVDVQANTAILSELVRNLEMAKMSLLQETPLIQIIDKPILPLEKDKFGKLKGFTFGAIIAGLLMGITLTAMRFFKKVIYDE